MTVEDLKGKTTRADLANRLNISRQAVGKAVKAGRLILGEDKKIDLTNPVNQEFIMFHHNSVKSAGGNGRPVRIKDNKELSIDTVELGRNLENQIRSAKLKQAELKNAKNLKELIPVEMVARSFSILSVLLNDNFRSFDERNSAELYLAAQTIDERAFSKLLADKINDSMEVVITSLQTEVKKYRKEN